MREYHTFAVEHLSGATIVRIDRSQLSGDVDAEFLTLELKTLVADSTPRILVIDFENVQMISSTVIASFIQLKKHLDHTGAHLKLCSMPVPVREIYQTLNLEGNVFDIYDTISEALR